MPFILPLILVLAMASGAAPSGAVTMPDPRKGEIDGLQAIVVYAYTESGGREELLPAERCVLHAVDEAGEEVTRPCGEWFILPRAGRYVTWIETPQSISARQALLVYRPTPFGGAGMMIRHAVVPAGEVAVRAAGAGEETVRVMSIERNFQRRFARRDLPVTLRVPAGKVLAGAFDAEGNAIAVSRPVNVPASGSAQVVPVRPERGSDVVAVLSRAPGSPSAARAELTLHLEKGESRKPDVSFATQNTFYGFWYAIDEPHALLRVTSPSLALRDTKLNLKPNAVSTIRTQLETK